VVRTALEWSLAMPLHRRACDAQGGRGKRLPHHSRKHPHQPPTKRQHRRPSLLPCFAAFESDFDGRAGFGGFPASDDVGASPIRPRGARGAFCDVEASALRCAKGFVLQLAVGDVGGLDGPEHLEGNIVGGQPVVGEEVVR
jgi:hypothetical protein